eukprot:CAMPEP_0197532298 /NCGR_PEP_ID=MMETSP1318-20131121/39172_1 /TAXON_ID=552666 /ORGANISM="Partenskyella glossopodia, Strain RCC365" /LENGTH=119 /DNA_ID=CAMNT_0043088815 /DNA_START=116 /DNA_END=476 /DNA_ORIENTATION=+
MSPQAEAAPFSPLGIPNKVLDFFGFSAPSSPKVPYSKVVVENARRTSPCLTQSPASPSPINADSFRCLSALPFFKISATVTAPESLSISNPTPSASGSELQTALTAARLEEAEAKRAKT